MLVRAYIRAYGLALVVLIAIGFWAYEDRLYQRDVVLTDTSVIATQQSQLVAKGISVFHVAVRYLLGEIVLRVEDEHLGLMQTEPELRQFYSGLLQNKLSDVPFLQGLSVIGPGCASLAVSDLRYQNTHDMSAWCEQLSASAAPSLQMHVIEPGNTGYEATQVVFVRQIVDHSAAFLGAVTTALDLEFVKDWFGHYVSRHNESITLLSASGQVLVHLSHGTSEYKAREIFLMMRQIASRGDARSANAMQAHRTALSDSGSGTNGRLSHSQNYRDQESIYALTGLEGLPLYVLVSYDLPMQLAQWREYNVKTGLFVFGLFLVSLLMVQSYLRVLQQREALAELATTDALTGMHNRRYLMEVGTYEVRRANRYNRPLSMLLVDADHFKEINDQWGHGAGDLVLKQLGHTIQANLRQTDVGARIGGEEFVVLLPETSPERAQVMAQRLRQAIEALSTQVSNSAHAQVTVSIGIAGLRPDESLDQLMSRADNCLYDAKENGRNQVVMAA